MKRILVLVALVAFVAVSCATPNSITFEQEWNEYKKSFGKFYTSTGENEKRANAYMETKRTIEEHNKKYEKGETTYKMGINQFADWFPEELNRLKGLKVNELKEHLESEKGEVFKSVPKGVVPTAINWVEKGAVTSVKNQGNCGSCYAVSAVGALEGMMYITNKTITDLSVQELIDCTHNYGNLGCKGGLSYECFRYVVDRKGISTEKSYPYEAIEGKCRAERGKIGAVATDYVKLPPLEEDKLVEAVGTVGPVAISYGVAGNFIHYKEGIYDGECSAGPNHGMLAVGYGKDKKTGKDYWLVKNSWGTSWGSKGYVKVIRNVGKCWIHFCSNYPIYKK